MGQVLHGSATTTEAVRRAIQHGQESVRALAERYSVNPKTVSKWKHRETVADRKTGPKEARSTVLTPEEEAVGECQESCARGRFHFRLGTCRQR
jgi:transposase-like protein